ncbi:hypothetical protein QQG55_56725 [Brugia pahangi]
MLCNSEADRTTLPKLPFDINRCITILKKFDKKKTAVFLIHASLSINRYVESGITNHVHCILQIKFVNDLSWKKNEARNFNCE